MSAQGQFARHRGELHCEGVPLSLLAERHGTPLYVYSSAAIRGQLRALRLALRPLRLPVQICYAVKAAGSLGLLSLLASEGAGFDIVSVGELFRVKLAGGDPSRVVFSGVGKRPDELAAALEAGILQFNCESEEELVELSALAQHLGKRAPVSLRVNPLIAAGAHPHIATALADSKFGIPLRRARGAAHLASRLPGLDFVGVGCHIGSQIDRAQPFQQAARAMRRLHEQLEADGLAPARLDLGGGLGVSYAPGQRVLSPAAYGRALAQELRGLRVQQLVVEPGRFLLAEAGVLVSRVVRTKRSAGRHALAVLDAGMNDLLRPALYGARHPVLPVGKPRPPVRSALVGPVCESSDVILPAALRPALQAGDAVAIGCAGAYGFSMASHYNARPRPAEVLVEGGRYRVIRERETLEDLVRGEVP